MTEIEICVNSRGDGWLDVMELTEKLGTQSGLSKKERLRLRLLAEELIGMLRGIAGDVEAIYRIEQENKSFRLRLGADVTMTQELRRELLDVSTSGENRAARGFMGKLREMIAVALLPKEGGVSLAKEFALGLMSVAGNSSPNAQKASADAFNWSMNKYKEGVAAERENGRDESGSWDELEKSIVASLADEVSVSVRGSHAEITIYKAF